MKRPRPWVASAKELIGHIIESPDGQKLGRVEELTLDLMHGRIAYVVIAFADGSDDDRRLWAVPFAAISLTPSGHFMLDLDAETLARAPSFDRDTWPDMSDFAWADDVHAFYETAPYWEQ